MTDRPSPQLLFIDLETVHLRPFLGSVWELAWMRLDDDAPTVHMVQPSLSLADPDALEVGGFFNRFDRDIATLRDDAVGELLAALDGRPALAGSAPWFDAAHLTANWPELHDCWHHHHVDVPTLVCGSSTVGDDPPPWRLSTAARWAGLDVDAYDRHTAAGDVLLTRDLYLAWKDGA